ncbi:hypothetical protein BKA69DRAFT_1082364 [Paraphysoderma sedebokerense]|nr:hypothetical protein BKA69DRAFT_1082309 [Paraphysoderma sedebokerense]KAI9140038.1 hypothetical protein BKA69DRAFT_1082364 [Paraphysoderma sedebokerense]
MFGARPCANVVLLNDTDLTCVIPQGSGANCPLTVTVAGQNSTNTVSYSYDIPVITSVLPRQLVSANPTISLDGLNFGESTESRVVTFVDVNSLQSYICPTVVWISQESLQCQFNNLSIPLQTTFNITVALSGQPSLPSLIAQFRTFIINFPPTVQPYNSTIYEDFVLMIQLNVTDSDIGDTVQALIISRPMNGSLYQVNTGGVRGQLIDTSAGNVTVSDSLHRVLYVPNANFYGEDYFIVGAKDAYNAESATREANITVLPLNDPPVIQSAIFTLDEDTEQIFAFSISDVDTPNSTDSLVISIMTLPNKGELFIQNSTDGGWVNITVVPYLITNASAIVRYRPPPDNYGNPFASFEVKANDGEVDSSSHATITFIVNAVNDIPIFNTTLIQNLTLYEDGYVIIPLDITDIDPTDKLSVKVTDISINGTLYHVDHQSGAQTRPIGEGSVLSGPPFYISYVPQQDYYTSESQPLEMFNISYGDGTVVLSQQINLTVFPANDPPVLMCPNPRITLPSDFILGAMERLDLEINVVDVDNNQWEFFLLKAPEKGYLNSTVVLTAGSSFNTTNITFHHNYTGGGYPYGGFSVYAVDKNGGVSNTCNFVFSFSCPPGRYNNIFNNDTGPICVTCLDGADCSQDGSTLPRPKYGYWQSDTNSTFLECFPIEACPGGSNQCAPGYEGKRCGSCALRYYRLNNLCHKCQDNSQTQLLIIGAVFLAGTLCAVGFLKLVGKGPNYGLANILINFIQYILIIRQLRLNWYGLQ